MPPEYIDRSYDICGKNVCTERCCYFINRNTDYCDSYCLDCFPHVLKAPNGVPLGVPSLTAFAAQEVQQHNKELQAMNTELTDMIDALNDRIKELEASISGGGTKRPRASASLIF